jgi:hypothetical protein
MIEIISDQPSVRTRPSEDKRPTAERRHARGGVSPRKRAPAARGLEVLVEPGAVSPRAALFPNFSYHGGAVIQCPLVYPTFWGNSWLSDPVHLERAGRLSQFLQDLINSNFMNVLHQYGVGFGAGAAGIFERASFVTNVPTTLTDADIQSIIQSNITGGVLPEPSPATTSELRTTVALIIYLDESIGVEDPNQGLVLCEPTNDTAFGYHSFFTTAAGNPCYYAVMPALSDGCLSESCPSNDGGCSLHLAETQEQRLTQVTSHEFAEMTTDPELNAWYDPAASEIGDICNGESDTITVGPNTWTVQRQYSKTDDINSNGATVCVTEASNPLPLLSPGPTARVLSRERMVQLQQLKHLFPLPPLAFDLSNKRVSMDERDVREYLKRYIHPFHHKYLVADLPGLLRSFATYLEKTPGSDGQ